MAEELSEVDRLRAALQAAERERDSLRQRWVELERIQDRQLTFQSVAMELAETETTLTLLRATSDAQLATVTRERDEARTLLEAAESLIGVHSRVLEKTERERDAWRDASFERVDSMTHRDGLIARADSKVQRLKYIRELLRESCNRLSEQKREFEYQRDEAIQERDTARAEAGRLAQEIVALTGKLVVADIENGRLREALEFYAASENWDYPGQHHYDAPTYEDNGKRAREALKKEGADDGRAD